jgi:hypothetical protein
MRIAGLFAFFGDGNEFAIFELSANEPLVS